MIIKAIYGTLDVYNAEIPLSKDQIEENIIELKAKLEQAKIDDDIEKVEHLEEVIKVVISELESAPDKVEATKYSGEYAVDKREGYESHYLKIRLNPYDKHTPALQIKNIIESKYSNGYDSSVLYEDVFSGRTVYNDSNINKLDYHENPIYNTPEALEAIQIANDFLEKCGINDRVIDDIIAMGKEDNLNEIGSYLFIYAKEFNNTAIPAYVQMGSDTENTTIGVEEYIASYEQETLYLEIRNREVHMFEWDNIYNVKEMEKDDIRLIPFDRIICNAENQLATRYVATEERNICSNIYIDKIMLTYAVEPIKDRKYEYRLIPVWAFYGGYDYGDGYETEDGLMLKGKQKVLSSLLTVNAVDGTVIFGQ